MTSDRLDTPPNPEQTPAILTPTQFLGHWQGHRRLTRRVICAFPEDQLFSFTAASGMRPFGTLGWEILNVAGYTLAALQSGDWAWPSERPAEPAPEQAALLNAWDELTVRLDTGWPALDMGSLSVEQDIPWGRQTAMSAALYALDNEVHHRAQGYVYLRALGLDVPPFWER